MISRALAAAGLALLAASATPAVADLSGQTAELAFFEGTWACTGRRFATPERAEQPFQATYDFGAVVGGAWLEVEYLEQAGADNPFPLNIKEFWGYDTSTAQYRSRWVSNFATSGAFEASGWQDGRWVWSTDHFPMGDAAMPMRTPFEPVGPDRFSVQPAFQNANGSWHVFAEFSCDRS